MTKTERFTLLAGLLVIALMLGGYAVATHTSQTEEHVVVFDPPPMTTTVVDTDQLPHETVTVFQTVTTTTTTPTTTTEPDPPGEVVDVVVTNALGWVCNRAVDISLLRVRAPVGGSADNAVTLDPGCTGVIERIEITTERVDGIKIRNNSVTPTHDLVINGGFIRSANCVPGGHCDGVQGMGGDRITFNNILIDFRNATGGGGFYPSLGGNMTGGQPTHIVCQNCHIIHGATSVRVDASEFSGIRNSVVCSPIGAAEHAQAVFAHAGGTLISPVGVSRFPVTIREGQNQDAWSSGNVGVPSNDPRCITEP
jgi:hypothetical protein